jgi:hypothetical protein
MAAVSLVMNDGKYFSFHTTVMNASLLHTLEINAFFNSGVLVFGLVFSPWSLMW